MLEPEDDILLPRRSPAPEVKRVRTRHAVRALAALLILVSVAYAFVCYRINKMSLHDEWAAELLGILPGIIFGALLWWYAGRESLNLHHPIFHRPTDETPPLSFGRGLCLFAGMLSGLIGLLAVTYGAIIRWYGEAVRTVTWTKNDVQHMLIWVPDDSVHGGLISLEVGVVLIVVAFVALHFARPRGNPARAAAAAD